MPIIWDEGGGPQLTLRQKIIATINSGAMAIVNGISEPIKAGLHNLNDWTWGKLEDDVKEMLGPTLTYVRGMEGMPDFVKAPIDHFLASHSPVGPFVIGAVLAIAVSGIIGAFLTGPLRFVSMGWMRIFRAARPSYRDVGEWLAKGYLGLDQAQSWLMDMGMPDAAIDAIRHSAHLLPTIPIIADMMYRKLITRDGARVLLKQLGYRDEWVDSILETYTLLPTMANLVLFAVREAFTPEVAERFGQYEDFPEAMMPWAEKIGMTREVARLFWAAHWTLPSPSQGFAMYHRGIIGWEDLNLLLKSLDIMPFWRDKLLGITYTLPTRVDIRRMYAMKLITHDQAAEMYRKRGYSPEDTALQMTLADNLTKSGDKELTKADILTAYTKLGWEREEAVEMLAELGYDLPEIDYYLDYADYQRTKEYTDTAEKLIKTQYVRGIINQATANARLGELGETAAQIAVLTQLWTLEKEATTEHPTVSQLSDFYERRIIAGPRLEAELSHLNYTSEYIAWIHGAIDARIAEENARKSAAQLRAEMARHRYPTLSDLDSWLGAGIINEATYRQRILDLGYSPQDADRFVEDQRRKLAGQPAFPSRADIGRWFLEGIVTREAYIARMVELGYTRADVDLYLAELYAKMTEEQKREEERLLKEEMARIRIPSRADLGSWFLTGIISREQYIGRMVDLGYLRADIDLYLAEMYAKMTEEKKAEEQRLLKEEMAAIRTPSRADLGRWFLTGIISRAQYIGRMLELNYPRADIDLYLAEMYAKMTEEKKAEEQRLLKEEMAAIRTPSRADLGRWFLVGLITREEYISRMAELGYSPEDIARYLVELTGKW